MTYRIFSLFLLFFSPGLCFAGEIIFEGYSRIEHGGKHAGYTIQRFEFDAKGKTFKSISFLRAKFGDKIVQESLKGISNDRFNPIAYEYTSQVGDTVRSIDGTFKGEVMTIKKIEGKTVRTETHKIPKGTFLSNFLLYMMLQKNLVPSEAFKYSAVVEEEGTSAYGKAMIQSKEDKGSFHLLRVLNEFVGEQFISKIAAVPEAGKEGRYTKAEIFSTNSPTKTITTELVSDPQRATDGQVVPNKTLMALFGNIPSGKLNMVVTPPQAKGP